LVFWERKDPEETSYQLEEDFPKDLLDELILMFNQDPIWSGRGYHFEIQKISTPQTFTHQATYARTTFVIPPVDPIQRWTLITNNPKMNIKGYEHRDLQDFVSSIRPDIKQLVAIMHHEEPALTFETVEQWGLEVEKRLDNPYMEKYLKGLELVGRLAPQPGCYYYVPRGIIHSFMWHAFGFWWDEDLQQWNRMLPTI
jgi:hypothetical protein